MVRSCITIVQYQNQEKDIGAMCVYTSVPFITCIDLGNHHCSEDTEYSITPKISLRLSFIVIAPTPPPIPGNY